MVLLASSHGVDLQVFLPLLGMVGVMVSALVFLVKSYRQSEIAASESKAANAAVNNVTPGLPTLYQNVEHVAQVVNKLADAQEDFAKRGWATLPDDIGTAAALTQTIRELQHQNQHQDQKLETILKELREHIEWEYNQKYYK